MSGIWGSERGGGGLEPVQVSTSYAADAGQNIGCDMASAWTLTLPSNPAQGDQPIRLWGRGGTGTLTVDGNGNTVEGAATMDLNIGAGAAELVFDGNEWRVAWAI